MASRKESQQRQTSAQREWAAKKQAKHEEEWGAGEKWLSGQFAAASSASHEIKSVPSAIQRKALNPDEMPVLDEEAMVCCVIAVAVLCDAGGVQGYDINIPKCYRNRNTAMPEDKTECEDGVAAPEAVPLEAAPEEAAPEVVAPETASCGEMNLDVLLANMVPELLPQEYVFAALSYTGVAADTAQQARKALCEAMFDEADNSVIALFKEKEGLTVYCTECFLATLPQEIVLEASKPMAMITLQIHSALDAVGLTAAFATELGQHEMSANVMAGFYHDHIFISGGMEMGQQAVEVLQGLSARKQAETA